jgi:hypothetical protein
MPHADRTTERLTITDIAIREGLGYHGQAEENLQDPTSQR